EEPSSMTPCLTKGATSPTVAALGLSIGVVLVGIPACTSTPPTPTAAPGPTARTDAEPKASPESKPSVTLQMQSFPLNTYKREVDGQWEGIRLASDGNVYFASSSHSAHHGASFFKYDTKSGQITELVHDITETCGEDARTNPQGKIHSDIVEADGWLY